MNIRRGAIRLRRSFDFLWHLRPGEPVTEADDEDWKPPSAATGDNPYPSLEVIERELERVELSNQTRTQGVDAKAGVIIGAAGVIVTLGSASHPSIAVVIGLFLAAVGGVFAAWALLPRVGNEVSPQRLVNRGYLSTSALQSRVTLLATRAEAHVSDEVSLVAKANRIKAAYLALLLAIATILIGLIISVSGGGRSGPSQQPSPAATQPSSPPRTTGPVPVRSSSHH